MPFRAPPCLPCTVCWCVFVCPSIVSSSVPLHMRPSATTVCGLTLLLYETLSYSCGALHCKLWCATRTSSARPHTVAAQGLLAQGRIHSYLKASYTVTSSVALQMSRRHKRSTDTQKRATSGENGKKWTSVGKWRAKEPFGFVQRLLRTSTRGTSRSCCSKYLAPVQFSDATRISLAN